MTHKLAGASRRVMTRLVDTRAGYCAASPARVMLAVMTTDQPRSYADRDTHTPRRTVRVPDAVWDAASARATREGTTVSAVVVRALSRYAKHAPAAGGQ